MLLKYFGAREGGWVGLDERPTEQMPSFFARQGGPARSLLDVSLFIFHRPRYIYIVSK